MASRKALTRLLFVIAALFIGTVLLLAGVGSRQLFERPRHRKAVAVRPTRPTKEALNDERFRVSGVQGAVEFLQEGKVYVLQAGDLLSLQDVIRTGAGARVLLRRKGSELEVRENLEIQLQFIADKQAEFSILSGNGDMSAKVEDSEATVKIRSDETQAVNVGPSRWVVARGEQGKVAVAVSQGAVQFAGRGRSVVVKAGRQSVAASDQPPSDPVETPADLLLDVIWPEETNLQRTATIQGKASPLSTVSVNGQVVDTHPDGSFKANVPLKVGNNDVEVKARDVLGRKKSLSGTLHRPPKAPSLEAAKEELWAP